MLIESSFAYLKAAPHRFASPLIWLAKGGKSTLKTELAAATDIDVTVLPYDPQVVAWLKEERAAGRSLVLATASHKRYAEAIANHLGLFDKIFATDAGTNLSAHRKRDTLIAEFGESNFDYVGNSHDDIPVWQAAANAYVVNPSSSVERAARKLGNVANVIKSSPSIISTWPKSLRIHQWLKNLLIFLPMLAAHQLLDTPKLIESLLAFLTFGLCASSVYLLNDLLDLEDDRHHPTKCRRPLASGSMPLMVGISLFPFCLISAFAMAMLFLPIRYIAVLIGYYVLTLAYSMYLKRFVMVDVVVLAMLYTTRIIAGATAVQVMPSFWLLAFSMFIFLSLAFVKRYAELHSMKNRGVKQSRRRGYIPDDLPLVSSLGSASGYLSILVLALYIQDSNTARLYHHPQWIWLVCPLLLYWISRIWIITHRGVMHDDPIVFAARDKTSIIVVLICAIIFWLAI